MESKQHLTVLQEAADGSLPIRIDSTSVVPVAVVAELVSGGYLTAIDASTSDGFAFVNVSITTSGRDHLRHLRRVHPPSTIKELLAAKIPYPVRVLMAIAASVAVSYALTRVVFHASRLGI
jgi:hypothetical protein